ncbi:unnamed protein product [Eruca vesicaria subsp. sativa]|uniref:Uncharacterized protein n=1 Tax=Eruca vesicaria subsp. sativa TaxID=29727 RepID=A0ABC8M8S9_ERUVS|nr:unnamed protein product [Eruca vesicaria subsp. sativa]
MLVVLDGGFAGISPALLERLQIWWRCLCSGISARLTGEAVERSRLFRRVKDFWRFGNGESFMAMACDASPVLFAFYTLYQSPVEVLLQSLLRTGLWFSKPGLRRFHPVCRVVLRLQVKELLGFRSAAIPDPSFFCCWQRWSLLSCNFGVGGECIVGFLAYTSVCVSQPFLLSCVLCINDGYDYKLRQVHQGLATPETSWVDPGIRRNEVNLSFPWSSSKVENGT